MAETTAVQTQLRISQIRNVLQAMGWEIVATDTRGSDILLTISRPKANPDQSDREA